MEGCVKDRERLVPFLKKEKKGIKKGGTVKADG